jgi:hypothetical protein
MEVSRDHEPIDWDAAWESLVVRLQRPRRRRIARAVGQATATLAVMAASVWLLLQLVAAPLHELSRLGA